MIFRCRSHEVPGLNTTSTADISFMLLIFFLVTTSMDVDKGLTRQLPAPEPKKEQPATLVDKSLLMALHITADGRLLLNDSLCQTANLEEEVKRFILREGKRHIISIDCDREASYNLYFQVQNSLKQAYSQVWNEAARAQYGQPLSQLNKDHKSAILERFPQRITESYANAMNAAQEGSENAAESSQTIATTPPKAGIGRQQKGGRP